MRLTVVGCSGSYPGPDSPASCYLVEADQDGRTWRVLLDLGSGALGRLHRHADPLSIDGVFISHLHPDHWFDMSGYYVLRKYHPAGAPPRIPVYGPRGVAKRLAEAYGLAENPGMTEEFDFHEYDDEGTVSVGPLTVEVRRVLHPVDAYAMRVTSQGRSLVYSGDTARCEALVDLARDTDLLVAEASFREGEENPPELHMTGKEAAETAVRAGAGRLVLTHIPPWYDPKDALEEARPVFEGPLELAVCGATYDL
ncbi:MBL fold metallo-hydrolase [Nocardioides sp. WL0053]|uniref:MBL fold metallo-hydrolase n=1 Tax=Nocardioides jiangsuensis TaxID=2866161 RepID=A0ABS7RND2_9ACTN|nr:MBL fold metallo-hydrolase [Nocardioides jiangsuensis]MBY9076563.1 MBL fold metallo-hydrolase [Nocardioides jiangsuensis]